MAEPMRRKGRRSLCRFAMATKHRLAIEPGEKDDEGERRHKLSDPRNAELRPLSGAADRS